MNRVCLGILKELEEEGVKIWWDFKFPEPKKLERRLKDYLEEEVDEKFYLSEEKVQQLLVNTGGNIDLKKQVVGTCHPRNDLSFGTRDRVYNSEMVSPTLTSTMYKDPPKFAYMGGMFDAETQRRL